MEDEAVSGWVFPLGEEVCAPAQDSELREFVAFVSGGKSRCTVFRDNLQRNVTKCGGVRKKVLREGEGWRTPEEGDRVLAHYIGRFAGTDDVFDSSHGKKPIR